MFQDSGEHSLMFLTLLKKQLQRNRETFVRFLPTSGKVRRYCGDLAWSGRGNPDFLVMRLPIQRLSRSEMRSS